MAGIARTFTTLALAVLLLATTADAALTTSACLVQKRKAWGNLRKCQVTEQVKQLKGKPADLAKCDTALQPALAKITAKATKAVIACRYGGNGDGTVTDYDTGLQWEQKDGEVGGICLVFPGSVHHCVNTTYTWFDALTFVSILNGSADVSILTAGFAGYPDWRLPTLAELQTTVDLSAPGCGSGSPCIDATAFGPTVASIYWSDTTLSAFSGNVWVVSFYDGRAPIDQRANIHNVRAVRGGL